MDNLLIDDLSSCTCEYIDFDKKINRKKLKCAILPFKCAILTLKCESAFNMICI